MLSSSRLFELDVSVIVVVNGVAPRGESELVGEGEEETNDGECEQRPRQTSNGSHAAAVVHVWTPSRRERVNRVAALQTVPEWRLLNDTCTGTEKDGKNLEVSAILS